MAYGKKINNYTWELFVLSAQLSEKVFGYILLGKKIKSRKFQNNTCQSDFDLDVWEEGLCLPKVTVCFKYFRQVTILQCIYYIVVLFSFDHITELTEGFLINNEYDVCFIHK